MTIVARELRMSRNGLAKICDRLLIPYPGRGYWRRADPATREARPPLPSAPAGGGRIVIAEARSKSRRRHTRLAPEARAEQLIEAAAQIVAKEGLAAASMKRVARDLGISEAQAHNYYRRRDDLLIALARRELAAMEVARLAEIQRGEGGAERVALSTRAYLRQVDERGALIQVLLDNPEVRAGLRAERRARATSARKEMSERLNLRYGLPRDLAYGATAVLTAVCLRAGRLLAARKIDLAMAERLSLAIVTAGNRAVAGSRRAD
jgi:AcrR family transcriptional regulator